MEWLYCMSIWHLYIMLTTIHQYILLGSSNIILNFYWPLYLYSKYFFMSARINDLAIFYAFFDRYKLLSITNLNSNSMSTLFEALFTLWCLHSINDHWPLYIYSKYSLISTRINDFYILCILRQYMTTLFWPLLTL